MRRRVWPVVILAAVLLVGCASTAGGVPAVSPQARAREECQRNGGAWREVLRFCEYRGGS